MDEKDVARIKEIAELEVRQYFDHYLYNVWPEQAKALKAHTHQMIDRHDTSKKAHGAVEATVTKWKWMLAGITAIGGLFGGGMVALGKSILGL